ncbi:hypothetical protein, partial [Prevotella sp.]|uniref:hypothetical protein n=1 Tax=Prevotella sp. TaxID=59823 RepID=UPI00307FE4C3
DGTAMQCGRVGNRLFSSRQRMKSSGREILWRTFLVSNPAENITVVSSLVLEFLPLAVFMV